MNRCDWREIIDRHKYDSNYTRAVENCKNCKGYDTTCSANYENYEPAKTLDALVLGDEQ